MHFDSVLFVCVHNRARSQMAEGLARRVFGDAVRVASAGSSPSHPHPLALQALQELGVDTSGHVSTHLDEVGAEDFDLIVRLCAEEACPVLPPKVRVLDWSMADPSAGEPDLDAFRRTLSQLQMRLDILAALRDQPAPLAPTEFHASVRVPDLPAAAAFYTWLLGVEPKVWTHRYVTFVAPHLTTNFVVLVDDGKTLHQDTLYHLGVELPTRLAIIDADLRAREAGWTIHKPARTTWRGTPLHELWLKDPGGNLVEVYARLTDAQLAKMPADQAPVFLTPPLPEST